MLMAVEQLSLIELEFVGDSDNEFSKNIKRYFDAHEGVTFRDLLKFLYQSVLGSHHIFDMMKENEVKKWIEKNLNDAEPSDSPLTEKLYGKKWVRINLRAFKKKYGNNFEKLFEVFLKGKGERSGSIDEFLKLQDELVQLVKNSTIKSSSYNADLVNLIDGFVVSYRRKGCPPLHHSKLYAEKNAPYLVVLSECVQSI